MKTSGFTVRGITFSAMFAALLVALSFVNIQLGISPVPITLVNFVIMLSGALLGPKYGFFSVFSVVLLTALDCLSCTEPAARHYCLARQADLFGLIHLPLFSSDGLSDM
nr:biotin transporter BioY [Paenibacillus larvae]